MTELKALVKRDTTLFFRDKGMFFSSMITPIILLFLYVAFLKSVYRDSFMMSISGQGLSIKDEVIDGIVGGQLMSSLLAVCCITVSFCSNMLMVQDKVTGAINDITISPAKPSTIALGYYISTALSTLIVCFVATAVCFVYLATVGFYLSALDVVLLFLDVFLLVMFGTALSSIINMFLATQGQISAIGTIVSAGYGFICGAYMPISQFPDIMQKIIKFLPGTYGTALLRSHSLNGAFSELGSSGVPAEVIDDIKVSVDCSIDFFGTRIEETGMFIILVASVVVLICAYVLLNYFRARKKYIK